MAKKRKDNKGRVLKDCEYQRSNGSYEYRWQDRTGKLNSVYSKSLDDLRQKEIEIERDIADGIDFAAGQKTVAQLAEEYYNIRSLKWKTNSIRAYSSALNHIKESSFGKKQIRKVKLSDSKKWFVQLNKGGLKRNTIQTIKSLLQPAFESAVEDDIIRKNPFRFNLSDLLPNDAEDREALTEAQEKHYIKFIQNFGGKNYIDDIILLKETGVRISELYGITFADVDLTNRVLHIRRQLGRTAEKQWFIASPKSKSGVRDIPLTDEACQTFKHVIANRPQPQVEIMIDGVSGFLFLDKDERPKTGMHCQNYMRNMHEKYVTLYGDHMPRVTPHILRHTFCTRMIQKGLDPKTVSYIMGHSKVDITLEIYTSADYTFIEQAFRRVMNPNESQLTTKNTISN